GLKSFMIEVPFLIHPVRLSFLQAVICTVTHRGKIWHFDLLIFLSSRRLQSTMRARNRMN
ncbi:hypothetical protein, partial [Iodidimonas nitroreducens]|uniref:hypothetical protein n=1 Tax=Iodidimonas nitroreducens TaxID=1236968 RepID=UPI0028CFF1BD